MQVSNKPVKTDGRVTAVLGPTNTGKTHYAVEQMVTYNSGCIGFPLRLLARENYDRLVALKGPQAVALVTGEEKIIPSAARYYSCTVESMPVDQPFEFLAVDEIQHAADPDRGHVFTDRLLRARGTQQTMFMGADTIRPLMTGLVPGIDLMARPRLSQLSYKGFKKITRLPPRSAVVAFAVDEVYAIAELIRRQRGGTAVVLGALSPRTRNRQVEMYQAGEVDFLVATDAIGMGLNMDIHHVALAATRKFDGQAVRSLSPAELAQIAGRAGRHKRDGTFGVTGNISGLDEDVVKAIESHEFESLRALYWRNSLLDFSSPTALRDSLNRHSGNAALMRGRPSDDDQALAHLLTRDSVMARASGTPAVKLLWEVCQIPDFRKTLNETHQDFVADIYETLMDRGVLPEDRVKTQMDRLDNTDGDVDALMTRIAHVRTWTYITHKSEWLRDAAAWADKARAIEDRLSDALHEGLMRRFVDRRSAVLMRAMDEGGDLLAGVRPDGAVVVEGQAVGHLEGFRFVADEAASGADRKAVMTAARNALKPEIKRRLMTLATAEDKQFKVDEQGQILFQPDPTNPLPGQPVGRLRRGAALLAPDIDAVDSPLLDNQDKTVIEERLKGWIKSHVATVLEPLVPLVDEAGIEGTARGIAFQLHEALGILPRADLEDLIGGLDETGRAALRARKVRLGPVLVFLPALNKPAAVRLRALLWSLWHGRDLPARVPSDGATSISVAGQDGIDPVYYRAIGYPVYGPRAIRVDMLDRLISAVYDTAKDGKFRATHTMAEWLGCSIPDLYEVIEAMGHKKVEEQKPESLEPEGQKPEEEKKEESTPAVKPELALFQLRRGKAYSTPRPERQKPEKKTERPQKTGRDRRPPKKKESREERQDRIISSRPAARPEDSPFAVLQSLKVGKDGKG